MWESPQARPPHRVAGGRPRRWRHLRAREAAERRSCDDRAWPVDHHAEYLQSPNGRGDHHLHAGHDSLHRPERSQALVRKRNFFDTILENVGFGGVVPGYRAFAARYVVKGHPEARAPRKERRAHGPQACQLAVYTTGVITDPNRLVGLIAVARETLNALATAGMAARQNVVSAGGCSPSK